MLILITYDVNTEDREGKTRLRRVAKLCLDYGQRVQLSVFECEVDPGQWETLRHKLVSTIAPEKDSLRFYRLGRDGKRRVEHVGIKEPVDLEGPLVV